MHDGVLHLTRFFRNAALPPRRMSLREFAETRVVVPEGNYEGLRFQCATMPWSGLLFDAIDSDQFSRVVVTGCVQGGKTLCGYVIPVLWHLFEHGETVVAGVPQMKTANDKWRTELKPAIDASPDLARFLPTTGQGSKGGTFDAIRFSHGAELKFMSGGGEDEDRSHYTTRVCAVTEADRLDTPGASSRESAPIYQIEGRNSSYGEDGRFYAECTPTTTKGYVWKEYQAATASRILKPCPHCGGWVAPEREHFVGWDGAASADHAAELASFVCPECGERISEDERTVMCRDSRLVHVGQRVEADGSISGERPATRTLGFRFSAFDNLMWTPAFIAYKSFEAQAELDEESADLKMRQQTWALPAEPELKELAPLTLDDVLDRQSELLTRGLAPDWAELVTAAIDLRATQLHYVLMAWSLDGFGHLVDCGSVAVERAKFGVEKGLKLALGVVGGVFAAGVRTVDGRTIPVGWTPIDASWKPDVVRWFVRKAQAEGVRIFLPAYGRGAAAGLKVAKYRHPTAESERYKQIGDQYYLSWHDKHRLHAVFNNADHWKTTLRERLATPPDEPGAITVFDAVSENDQYLLRQYGRHLTSERPVEKSVVGKGPVTVWENTSRAANHWLDVSYMATAAAHLQGVRVMDEAAKPEGARTRLLPAIAGPDGMPVRFDPRRAA